ncbi:MAG: PDZ domain-containing protein [Phycisphaerales bacterium]|nr:PDZ domain-containing protein [Phycisphaerales bacterium]
MLDLATNLGFSAKLTSGLVACVALAGVPALADLSPRAGVPVVAAIAPQDGAIEKHPLAGRPLAEVVADLGSADFQARDRASLEMLSRTDTTMPVIADLLKAPGLKAEARARLLATARDVFQRTPRGALGVQFGGGRMGMGNGLTISRLIPGFPSAKTLRVGDQILEINSVEVRNTSTFNPDNFALRPHVIARDPGTTVRVKVARPVDQVAGAAGGGVGGPGGGGIGGMDNLHQFPPVLTETLTLDVELGEFESLLRNNPQGDFISPDQLAKAWVIRQGDLVAGEAVQGQELVIAEVVDALNLSERPVPRVTAGGEAAFGRPGGEDARFDLATRAGRMGREFGDPRLGGNGLPPGFAQIPAGMQGRWQIQIIDPNAPGGPGRVQLPDIKIDLGNPKDVQRVLNDEMRRHAIQMQISTLTLAREAQMSLIKELKRAIGEADEDPDADAKRKELMQEIEIGTAKLDQIDAELQSLRKQAEQGPAVP